MRRRQLAQAIVWIAVLVPSLFLPILGLSIDAGVLFDARRELQNVADGAARVGAMEIDRAFLHNLGNTRGEVQLDRRAARESAENYLTQRARFRGSWDTPDVSDDRISITVHRELNPPFLRLFRTRPFRISATGRATPCSGVTQQTATCNQGE